MNCFLIWFLHWSICSCFLVEFFNLYNNNKNDIGPFPCVCLPNTKQIFIFFNVHILLGTCRNFQLLKFIYCLMSQKFLCGPKKSFCIEEKMCTCGLCGPFSCGCLPKTKQTLLSVVAMFVFYSFVK